MRPWGRDLSLRLRDGRGGREERALPGSPLLPGGQRLYAQVPGLRGLSRRGQSSTGHQGRQQYNWKQIGKGIFFSYWEEGVVLINLLSGSQGLQPGSWRLVDSLRSVLWPAGHHGGLERLPRLGALQPRQVPAQAGAAGLDQQHDLLCRQRQCLPGQSQSSINQDLFWKFNFIMSRCFVFNMRIFCWGELNEIFPDRAKAGRYNRLRNLRLLIGQESNKYFTVFSLAIESKYVVRCFQMSFRWMSAKAFKQTIILIR